MNGGRGTVRGRGCGGTLAGLLLVIAGAAIGTNCRQRDEPAPVPEPPASFHASLDDARLDRFLLRETGLDPATIDPAARERLREELVAEALFADAAAGQGLYAPKQAIIDETRRMIALGSSAAASDLDDDARRHVLAQLYESTVLMPQVKVEEAETDEEVRSHAPQAPVEQVLFRFILVDSPVKANAAYERLKRGRESFQDVAGQVSQAPDKGMVQARTLDQIPPAAAAVLKKLKPGEMSRPVGVEGSYYVFRLEERRPPPAPGPRERESARDRVFERKYEALRTARLEELARAAAAAPGNANP